MRVIVDCNGTIVGNVGGISDAAAAEALLEIKELGHEVCICSGAPGPDVADKVRVLAGDLSGAAVVDDDYDILRCVLRRGAIAVPAARLLDLADALRGRP